jgi:hypothetical protein
MVPLLGELSKDILNVIAAYKGPNALAHLSGLNRDFRAFQSEDFDVCLLDSESVQDFLLKSPGFKFVQKLDASACELRDSLCMQIFDSCDGGE